MRSLRICAGALCALAVAAHGSIVYSTPAGSYSQNFDSLITTGVNQSWANDSSLTGWHLFRRTAAADATPVAITAYNAGDGASNTGSFYSFGTGTGSERSLGGAASGGAYFGAPASAAIAGWIAVSFQNATGVTLDTFTLGFNGEQWRNGGNASAQTMVLEYGFGASFNSVATWIAPGGAFDWASPVVGTTAAAVDGNVAGLVSGRGGSVTGLTWANGDTLWVRWIERNDAGNDHGLAIDDVSFSAVPTPGALALGALGLLGAGRRRR